MPNRAKHARVGAVMGGAVTIARQMNQNGDWQIPEAIGGVLGGWLGGIMPDILEPATSPNHRALAHSVAFIGLAAKLSERAEWEAACVSRATHCSSQAQHLLVGSRERGNLEFQAFLWRVLAGAVVGFAIGYLSHALLDAGTPRGIPLISLR